MNLLAHLFLADNSDASRIGNLLGDFTKGPMNEIAKLYPPEVTRGIHMHRVIDGFTDAHPAFKASRQLLAPERRRFAGIIVDLFFDHFLSVHWQDYHSDPLDEFCQQVYRELKSHPEWLSDRLAKIIPIMTRENWLMRYSTMDGMELTLSEVSHRSPRISKIADGMIDLRKNYGALEAYFHIFMTDVLLFAEEWKKKNESSHYPANLFK